MEMYLSDERGAFRRSDVGFKRDPRAEMELVACRPDVTYQTIVGFGGAFTEAGAYTFAQMPSHLQDDFMRLYFTGDSEHPEQGGNAYKLCRTHIQSCDFSLGNYSYVTGGLRKVIAGTKIGIQSMLDDFSIEHDRQLLIPFIQCALALAPDLQLVASPWSPPAFMKNNLNMNYGGRLRKKFYGHWAAAIAAYVQAYRKEGVNIGRLTVQNEPSAPQTWDSCLFSAEQEALFAKDYLRKALDEAGEQEVRLLLWDHNKDQVLERVEQVLASAGDGVFDGVAFHWYAGDHFESLAEVARRFPSLELIPTEGCVEYLRNFFLNGPDAAGHAEHYAHDILGDLLSGAAGFIDWNLLLDEQGGPNHARNYCEAPLIYDRGKHDLIVNRSFTAIGHFSRFIEPGAKRFFTSRYSARFLCGGFVNPDGTRVLVALNESDNDEGFKLFERPWSARIDLPAHSLATLRWSPAETSG